MPTIERAKDSQSDVDFLAQLYGFAERKAIDGVYSARIRPLKGQRALVIVAMGEQADYLEHLLMKAASTNVIDEIRQRNGF